jgi:hypothetical protein
MAVVNLHNSMAKVDRLYLVSCVSQKQSTDALASDLYISPWFLAAREYVKAADGPWFILSAMHGLVSPSKRIATYNQTLVNMKIAQRRAWASGVVTQMDHYLPDARVVVVFAGVRYREFLMEYLERRFSVEVPLRGLRIGEQLQWFGRNRAHVATR